MKEFVSIDLLQRSGRLSYDDLVKACHRISREHFMEQFVHPLLVGSSLYTGELMKSMKPNATMAFVFTEFNDDDHQTTAPDPTGLRRSIYPLLKKPESNSPAGIFTIGRTAENDMVMADFAISRHHARLRIEKSRYILQDLNATNGCFHGTERLTANQELEIKPGDQVTFGRYAFYFTHAGEVYDQLRNH